MLPKPVAWAIGIVFILGTVFVGVVYDLIGVMGAGVLSILTGIAAFLTLASFLTDDRRTKNLLLVAFLGFTGRRIWDMAIAFWSTSMRSCRMTPLPSTS